MQRVSSTGGGAGGRSSKNVCSLLVSDLLRHSAACRVMFSALTRSCPCLMVQKEIDSCTCCAAFQRLSCVRSSFVLTNRENKEGREPRRVRGRGSAERASHGRATERMSTHDFDDVSSVSPSICCSPQLSNISSISFVVAMTRNKWWRLFGVGSVTACRR